MNKNILRKYAQIVTKMGVNVQSGQDVVIYISTAESEFASYLTEECYKLGARRVAIEWEDEKITRLKMEYESYETLTDIPEFILKKEQYKVDRLPCLIHVDTSNPERFNGLDMQKIISSSNANRQKLKKYRDEYDNKLQWVIVALPSVNWAKKVFPNETIDAAYKKLEEAIIKCTRLDTENPTLAWEKHIEKLKVKAETMNKHNFSMLEYKSSNGTNLKIELPEHHVWISARETTLLGHDFTANMPTEEVFTSPSVTGVNGVVVSTKPLSYRGGIIDDFKIYFENGRVEHVEAKVGLDLLEQMINTDEGSRHLGEVALVPYDSPINKTNILFFNTLFDENACCHLALGNGFANCVKDYEKYTLDELKEKGLNTSLNHVDFMVGSNDLSIIGHKKDGTKIEVFKNGIWNI